MLFGIAVLFFLTDRPSRATWLTDEQRAWLTNEMDTEREAALQATGGPDHGLGEVLRSLLSWNVMRLALIYFGLTTGLYGIELWLPQIVQAFGVSTVEVGFIVAIPYAVAIATMLLWASYSDRSGRPPESRRPGQRDRLPRHGTGRRRQRASGVDMVFLSVSISCVMASRPPFWTLPTEFLSGRKAAAGIAAINSIGNLGGFFGPTLIGYARDLSGRFTAGLMVSAATLLASTVFTLSLRRRAPAHTAVA